MCIRDRSGINPMEVFGVIVLLAAKAASAIGQLEAFFVAAIVAVACGLVGDVMNDFKAGYIVKSSPKAQWLGEVIGGVIGSVVSVAILFLLINAYGVSEMCIRDRPRTQNGIPCYDMTPAEFAQGIAYLKEKGVKILGGCCGADPHHIEAVAQLF